jgi:hypothetical protein
MRRSVVTIAVLLTLSVLATQAQDKVLLRHKFTPDERLTYAMDAGGDVSMVVTDKATGKTQPFQFQMKMRMGVSQETKSVDNAGVGEVNMQYGTMAMDMTLPGMGQMHVDLDPAQGTMTMGGKAQPLPAPLTAMLSQGITMKITPQGKVESIQGGEGLQKVLEQAGMRGMDLQQMTQQNEISFPEQPVGPGDTWVQKVKMPLPGAGVAQEMTTTYRFEGFEDFEGRKCAKLAATMSLPLAPGSTVEMPTPGQENLKVTLSDMSLDGKGDVLFDPEAGKLVHSGAALTMSMVTRTKGTVLVNGAQQAVDVETNIQRMNMNVAMNVQ